MISRICEFLSYPRNGVRCALTTAVRVSSYSCLTDLPNRDEEFFTNSIHSGTKGSRADLEGSSAAKMEAMKVTIVKPGSFNARASSERSDGVRGRSDILIRD